MSRRVDPAGVMETLTAAQIIDTLSMQPHPEGGHFVETFRDISQVSGAPRSVCTAIYYLLQAGETSAWHRVTDASEIWHWYAGAPLTLRMSPEVSTHRRFASDPIYHPASGRRP